MSELQHPKFTVLRNSLKVHLTVKVLTLCNRRICRNSFSGYSVMALIRDGYLFRFRNLTENKNRIKGAVIIEIQGLDPFKLLSEPTFPADFDLPNPQMFHFRQSENENLGIHSLLPLCTSRVFEQAVVLQGPVGPGSLGNAADALLLVAKQKSKASVPCCLEDLLLSEEVMQANNYASPLKEKDFTSTRNLEGKTYEALAVDCEMCGSHGTSVLARVSIVDLEGAEVFDALVKPQAEITDYRTR
jgi:hypothetical protein